MRIPSFSQTSPSQSGKRTENAALAGRDVCAMSVGATATTDFTVTPAIGVVAIA